MIFDESKRSREIKQKGEEVKAPPINKTRKKHIKVIADTNILFFQEEVEKFINDENIVLDHNPIYSTATVNDNMGTFHLCQYIAFIKYEKLVD